ncbi:hypothetical protein KZZ52_02015 [Dactylosporangium sp. AC04546]|uniref:hypothetical protein n=1 Tax=Dactylosporangium sp. AC04546 TaxID=2862460 RepID=UPI002E7BB49E|nr:hypothetical protein [Dactylosporangium sp. AC04546]WVK84235.1 hypothetical protein KZZ52_02015 [Dactylosporangium sp. AC04546]
MCWHCVRQGRRAVTTFPRGIPLSASKISRWAAATASVTAMSALASSALLLTSTSAAVAAPAKLVSITIKAVVDDVIAADGALCADVEPGDTITGTYVYNAKARDYNDGDHIGDYSHTTRPYGINLRVNGAPVRTNPADVDFLVELVNDDPGVGYDAYSIASYSNLPFRCGTPVNFIGWSLADLTGTALSTTALDRKGPRIAAFKSSFELVVEGWTNGFYLIRAHVTSARPCFVRLGAIG